MKKNTSLISGLLHSTSLRRSALMISLAAGSFFLSDPAKAVDDLELPAGGTVVGGTASFDYSTTGRLDIGQSSDRLVVDWDSFNIGRHATTTFVQPGTNALAVNRVTGNGDDPTQILGTLKANGRVMVLDRNGVVFGKGSRVDVGGIVASTGDVDTAAVMSGSQKLTLSNPGDAAVENAGDISVADSGLAALVAPTVRNSGTITARLGRVALASGDNVTVDLYGDGLIEVALDSQASKAVVEQTGTINAEGGVVEISARAAKGVVDSAINMDGVINASSVSEQGGRVVLSADQVSVTGAIKANGSEGGTVLARADKKLSVKGTIEARGAKGTGFVDTSAPELEFASGASVVATGEWLIDPTNITIDAVLEGLLETQLASGDATITTPGGGGDAGDISVDETVDWSTGNLLTLNAINDILFDKASSGLNASGAGRVILNAGRNVGITNGSGIFSNGGDVAVNAQRFKLTAGQVNAGGGNIDINNTAGFQALASSITTGGTGQISLNQNKDADAFLSINTIQNAINAVENTGTGGSSIDVGAGTYAENLNINEARLVLRGANAGTAGYGARVAETVIAAPFGSTISAAQVTVNGFKFDAGLNQLGVNFAPDATVANSIFANALADSFYLFGSVNAAVYDNLLTGINGNGIDVLGGSHNATITRNVINNVGTGSGLGSTAILVDNADGSFIRSNYIGFVDAGVTSAGNDNVKGDGILVRNVTNAGFLLTDISFNYITDTKSVAFDVGSGVHVRSAHHVDVNSNTISSTGWDGVRLQSGSDADIYNNTISNVARTGIYATGLTDLLLEGNNVDGAGTHYGFDIDNSTDVSVRDNFVKNTNLSGINLTSLNGLTEVDGNTVDGAGSSGISADKTSNLKIRNNRIGLSGTINGDGILVSNSTNLAGTRTEILGNEITGTLSPAWDYGSGVHVRLSNHVDVGGVGKGEANTIYSTGWDGVRLFGGSDINATNNQIDDVARTGIYGADITGLGLTANDIDGTGSHFGIDLFKTTDTVVEDNKVNETNLAGVNVVELKGLTQVTGNEINNTGSSGIAASKTSNLRILANRIGLNGPVNGDGILVVGSSNSGGSTRTVIQGNEITGTLSPAWDYGSGVHVRTSSHVDIGGLGVGEANTIYNTGWDAVRLFGGTDANVVGNDIDDVARTGIYAEGIKDLLVAANDINGTGTHYGIDLFNGRNSTIDQNTINATNLSGINLFSMTGPTVVTGNTITNAGTHGIETRRAENLEIGDNVIDTVAQSGVYVRGPEYNPVEVYGNSVTNADVGMTFESGLIDLQGATNTLVGGTVGYRFAPIPVKGGFSQVDLAGDTIGTTVFSGQSSYYVELLNEALFAPGAPTLEDGLNATYDGFNPALAGGILTPAELASLEAKFWHYNDDPTVGLFFFGEVPPLLLFNRVFRDDISGFTPPGGAAGFTITGLPNVPGNPLPGTPDLTNPADLNLLAPAAGGGESGEGGTTPEQLNALAPAAGGQDTACWSDAVTLASTGQVASYNFSTDPLSALQDATACGTPNN